MCLDQLSQDRIVCQVKKFSRLGVQNISNSSFYNLVITMNYKNILLTYLVIIYIQKVNVNFLRHWI